MVKGWSVTIIGALLALSQDKANVLSFVLMVAIILWFLDGYFLYQERLYRALFDNVRGKNNQEINFSMRASEFHGGYNTWFQSTFSPTLAVFYVPVVFFVLYTLIK